MKCHSIFLAVLCLFCGAIHAQTSRNLLLSDADVGEVRVALGYSTILQFDSRPTSVVLGDQDAFKVEYVGNSLTLKPVVSSSRTNLFVFTEYERFNFRLITGHPNAVDFAVRVKRRSKTRSSESGTPHPGAFEAEARGEALVPVPVSRFGECNGIRLKLDSLASPEKKHWVLAHFSLSWKSPQNGQVLTFQADEIAILSRNVKIAGETLFLEKLSLAGDGTLVRGSALIRSEKNDDLAIVFDPAAISGESGLCRPIKVSLNRPILKKKKG